MTWFDEQLQLLVQLEESKSGVPEREISSKLNELLFHLERVHLDETSNIAKLRNWILSYPDALGLNGTRATPGPHPCIFKIFADDNNKSKLHLLPFLLEEAKKCGFMSCLSLKLMDNLSLLGFLVSATQYGYDEVEVVDVLSRVEFDANLIYEEDLQTLACASLSKAVIQYLDELDPNSLLREFMDDDFNSFEKVWSIKSEENAEEYGWKTNEYIKDEEDFPSLIFFLATRGLPYLKAVLPIFLKNDIGGLLLKENATKPILENSVLLTHIFKCYCGTETYYPVGEKELWSIIEQAIGNVSRFDENYKMDLIVNISLSYNDSVDEDDRRIKQTLLFHIMSNCENFFWAKINENSILN